MKPITSLSQIIEAKHAVEVLQGVMQQMCVHAPNALYSHLFAILGIETGPEEVGTCAEVMRMSTEESGANTLRDIAHQITKESRFATFSIKGDDTVVFHTINGDVTLRCNIADKKSFCLKCNCEQCEEGVYIIICLYSEILSVVRSREFARLLESTVEKVVEELCRQELHTSKS